MRSTNREPDSPARKPGWRRYMKGKQITAESIEIRHTGKPCRMTSYTLLRLMGKTDTSENQKTLHNRLIRL